MDYGNEQLMVKFAQDGGQLLELDNFRFAIPMTFNSTTLITP